MRTFVFAIGGTGARVLRSFTMLLAAGAKGTNQNDVIVPVIIDYDRENHDTTETMDILDLYQKINKQAYSSDDKDKAVDQFFCSPVQKLKEFNDDTTSIDENARFQVYLTKEDTETTFAKHIGYATLDDSKANTSATARLLEVLYDTSDTGTPTAELHLSLEVGFKGCPNIGTVVSKSLSNTTEMKRFLNMLNSTGDRVVIIGSVFGGTGASGIPMLLDLIQEKFHGDITIPVAVIAVTPYFTVETDSTSAIDSDTFSAKTRAALDAYNLGASVNMQSTYIYYVGDYLQLHPYKNSEGGKTQNNPAHFVELAAAIDVLHFMQQQDQHLLPYMGVSNPARPIEFGISTLDPKDIDDKVDIHQISYKRLEDNIKQNYIYALAKFVLLSHFSKHYMLVKGNGDKNDNTWLVMTGLANDTTFKEDLDKFIDMFYAWALELQNYIFKDGKYEKANSKRDVSLFNVLPSATYDDIFFGIYTDEPGKVWGRNSLIDEGDDIRAKLNESRKQDDKRNPARFYFDSMEKITGDIMTKVLKSDEKQRQAK